MEKLSCQLCHQEVESGELCISILLFFWGWYCEAISRYETNSNSIFVRLEPIASHINHQMWTIRMSYSMVLYSCHHNYVLCCILHTWLRWATWFSCITRQRIVRSGGGIRGTLYFHFTIFLRLVLWSNCFTIWKQIQIVYLWGLNL